MSPLNKLTSIVTTKNAGQVVAGIKRKAGVVWCVEAESNTSAEHEVAMGALADD